MFSMESTYNFLVRNNTMILKRHTYRKLERGIFLVHSSKILKLCCLYTYIKVFCVQIYIYSALTLYITAIYFRFAVSIKSSALTNV